MPPIQPRATLQMTPGKTLEDLNTFLDKAQGNEKVFGTKTFEVVATKKDGKTTFENVTTTTLYIAKNASDSGSLKHDRNHASKFNLRRETALEALGTVLRNTAKETTDNSDISSPEEQTYRSDIRGKLKTFIGNEFGKPKNSPSKTEMERKLSPTAQKNTISTVKAGLDHVKSTRKNMAKYPSTQKLPESKSRLLEGGGVTLEYKTVESETVKKDFPRIEIDGKAFMACETIGAGSFGVVVRYVEEDGGAQRIVKFAHKFDDIGMATSNNRQALDEHRSDATKELAAGTRFGRDAENVMGYTDHVEMGNETIALIGEDGGGGSVADFAKIIHNVGEKKLISPHTRRLVTLTMSMDIAKGVSSIHNDGALHGDMKPGNQVVNSQGRVKVIDLGLTGNGTKSNIRGQDYVWASGSYNAPEAIVLEADAKKDRITATERAAKRVPAIKAEFKEFLEKAHVPKEPGAEETTPEEAAEQHAVLFQKAAFASEADRFALDGKSDVFGIGQSVYLLSTGQRVVDNRVGHVMEDQGIPIERGRSDGSDRLTPPEVKGLLTEATDTKEKLARSAKSHGVNFGDDRPIDDDALVDATGDPVMDLLLDDLLAPNPENRISLDEMQNSNLMQYGANENGSAIGSKLVTDLIVAIGFGSDQQIEEAEAALLKVFPEPDMTPYNEAIDARKFGSLNSSSEDYDDLNQLDEEDFELADPLLDMDLSNALQDLEQGSLTKNKFFGGSDT